MINSLKDSIYRQKFPSRIDLINMKFHLKIQDHFPVKIRLAYFYLIRKPFIR